MNMFLNQAIRSLIQSFHGQLDSLSSDESTIEYISDLLSDLEITNDEKQETIHGILELHLDPSQQQASPVEDTAGSASNSTQTNDYDPNPPTSIQQSVLALIERAHSYLSNPEAHVDEKDPSASSRASSTNSRSSSSNRLTKLEKEDEKMKEEERKKAILNQYGKVEIDQSSLNLLNGKSKEIGPNIDGHSSEDEVPKDLLDQELKLLDMKKRQRKKIESKKYSNNDDILLRPNLNSKLVEHENKLKKQELSEKNKLKIQKDKADLIKQRENQEKKKMEARSKAKKLERRA